jgi:hypothetical protein
MKPRSINQHSDRRPSLRFVSRQKLPMDAQFTILGR